MIDHKSMKRRHIVLTQLQKQQRERRLPETLKKIDALPVGLVTEIRKVAGVSEDVSVGSMNPSQRNAMRDAAKEIYLKQKTREMVGHALILFMEACTTDDLRR